MAIPRDVAGKSRDEPGASYRACKQGCAQIFWGHNKEPQGPAWRGACWPNPEQFEPRSNDYNRIFTEQNKSTRM